MKPLKMCSLYLFSLFFRVQKQVIENEIIYNYFRKIAIFAPPPQSRRKINTATPIITELYICFVPKICPTSLATLPAMRRSTWDILKKFYLRKMHVVYQEKGLKFGVENQLIESFFYQAIKMKKNPNVLSREIVCTSRPQIMLENRNNEAQLTTSLLALQCFTRGKNSKVIHH